MFLVDPDSVGVYHCINRCVRRTFLCGDDPLTGKNYDHRKRWIQERMQFLAGEFGLDVLGFAIMSNHLHIVLRNRPDVVAGWSDEEAARRWWNVFPGRRNRDGTPAEPEEHELRALIIDGERLERIRRQLSSVSWFMRCLVERIARSGNREDLCTGRFWEGRYKCQPILDEAALAACLAYVDLNPIRAGIAETPETSQFTSVYERIQGLREVAEIPDKAADGPSAVPNLAAQNADGSAGPCDERSKSDNGHESAASAEGVLRGAWLSPLDVTENVAGDSARCGRASNTGCLPMSLAEYLDLVDWTGRQLRSDKRGAISADQPPILERLKINPTSWIKLIGRFSRLFRRAAGTPASILREGAKRGCQRMQGIRHSRELFA
jgi:REP element-mobilizing transposase RayT